MIKLPTSLIQFFFYFIKKRPIPFLVFFLAPFSFILEANLIPYALKMLIDIIVEHSDNKSTVVKDMEPALWLGGCSWFGYIIITRLQNWWQSYEIPRFEADIRMSVLNYILYHSYNYFSNQLAGNLANKVGDLAKSIETIRAIICLHGVSAFAVVSAALIMMGTINQLFSLILGLWIIVHLVLSLYLAKFVNKVSKENAEDKSILNGSIVDTISNIISVKTFARRYYELTYVGIKQKKEKTSNSRLLITLNIFHLCMDIPILVMLGGILYFLITYWQQETISTGDFVFIFNMALAVMYQMWHLSNALGDLFLEIGKAQQALTLITCPHEIIDCPNAKPIIITKGEIKFSNVTFHYNKGDNIFENKNVVIKSGQKVGLVGFSGSGKSTFINLILHFFEVKSGTISIDGHDITKITLESLCENIAMIPQDTGLFHRTLIENIRYGRVESTDEDIIEASKKAYCHEFITQLTDGYNTLVGERGIKLSGGQRQRIAIARAILKDAPILILDEATSALDSVSERYIQESLHKLMKGRTTIVIAHRLSTLSKMDRILVFDKGHIIEDGTHNELLKEKKHYAHMWEMQAGGFLPDK